MGPMNRGRFGSAIAEARRRVDEAMTGGLEGDPGRPSRSRAILGDLQNTLEELLAAEAELRRQDADLLAAIAEAEAERNRYRELFELMPSGYLVMDRKGVIQDVNRAAQTLLGYPASELVGRPLASLVTMGRECVCDAISDARRGRLERADDLEVELRRRGAPPLSASLTIAAARNDGGQVTGLRALLLDARERRRAEEAARAASAARAADVAKDEFVATLSHELRTPLSAILGWSQILRSEAPSGEFSYALQSIERNSLHLNRLVDDLLDVSRIMRGKLTFDMRPCELTKVVADAIDAVWASVVAGGLRLRARIGETRPVFADPARLRQALVNLLSNAVKFSLVGGTIELAVSCTPTQFRIVVREWGSGIDPALLPHVFERFRQGRATATRPNQGLGLGLAIVREIVLQHGGGVSVKSGGEGRGATFTMAMPLVHHAHPGPGDDFGAEHIDPGSPLRGLHLLALATPRASQNGLSSALANAGADVATTHSVSDAIDRARALGPDCLVIEATARSETALMPLARAVDSFLGGDVPIVICTRRQPRSSGWQALDASLQVCVAGGPGSANIIALLRTVARLRSASITRPISG